MLHNTRRQLLRASGAAGLLAALGAGRASAQALDVVKIITGFPPGGTSDTLCRRVAEGLKGGSYAKVAVVENKAGAGGQIAVQSMKGAPIDGSVILQTPASMLMIYPHIYKKLAYDPFVDVTAITMACTFDFAWAVGPAVPATVKTVPDFLAWCKANPTMANFGSPAAGSVPHFIGVLLGQSAGIELKHIAYRGTQPAIQDLVAGQVQAVSGPVGEFLQQAAAGKVRILGVSGKERSRFAPDVPTYIEQGLEGHVLQRMVRLLRARRHPGAGDHERQHRPARGARPEGRGRWARRDGAGGDVLDPRGSGGAAQGPTTSNWGPIVKKIGFTADS